MKLCPACQRHLRNPEGCCPFCGAEQRSGTAGRIATVLLGVALSACSDRPLDETGTGAQTSTSGTGGTTGTSGSTSTSTSGTPTTGGTSTSTGSGATTMPGPTSDGTSSVGSTDSGVDEGDEGCAFYAGCPPDVGPSKFLCDPFSQDCPDGEKCMPMSEGDGEWQATGCVPVTGDKKHGEPCMAMGEGKVGLDDCEGGAICWDVDDKGQGLCADLCAGNFDDPLCGADQACIPFDLDSLFVCADACDPLLQGCLGDDVCIFFEDQFVCVLDASEDKGVALDPCEYINGCDPGQACWFDPPVVSPSCDLGASGCCTPFCELPDGACAEPDQVCKSYFELLEEPAPPGSEDVGICVFMMP